MTIADWALFISIGSLVVAIFSFVWNVWSKFIYPKPRVETSIAMMNLYDSNGKGPPFIALNATNFGPADVTLYLAIAAKPRKWFQRKKEIASLNPLEGFPARMDHSNGPFSGGLPKKLAVGEQFSAYFPVTKDWFTKDNLIDFGFCDTFGRNHWCPRKQGKNLKERVVSMSDRQTSEIRRE